MRTLSPALFLLTTAALVGCAESTPLEGDVFAGPDAPVVDDARDPMHASAARARSVDLAVTIEGPSLTGVGDRENIDVHVENLGSQKARNVELIIDLPTSGSLHSIPSKCTVSGAQAVCAMGGVKAGASKRVRIKWNFPSSETAVDFDAEATTTDTDTDAGNDLASLTVATTAGSSLALAGGESFSLTGCISATPITWADCATATALYYEPLTLNGDGSVTANTTAEGVWEQPNDYTLEMDFSEAGGGPQLSDFQAEAIDSDCFEGTVIYTVMGGYGAFQMCQSGFPTP